MTVLVTRICLTLVALLCLALNANGDCRQERNQLWSEYASLLAQPDLDLTRSGLLFLPGHEFESVDEQIASKADEYAQKLIELVQAELPGNAAYVYQLLHEAAYYGRDNLADKILNGKRVELKSKRATTSHPRLKWKRREYFRVTSEHYQVVSRDEQAAFEIAHRLELLYAVWRQVFLECWSDESELSAAIDQGKTLVPRTRRLHRVVLFSSQQEYTAYLQESQPRIGITKGFYDIAARTSYFFPSPQQSNHSTQFHEATHQLFQEVQKASERIALDENFWAIEGIAMYMESLRSRGPVASVGGVEARRLQFARYRTLQENFYVPLQELVSYGRKQIQQDERIRRIYTQSAGLSHLMMDHHDMTYRDGFIRYLKQIYQGRDRITSLPEAIQENFTTIDQEYTHFLRIDDQQLVSRNIPADTLDSLCLGQTNVTNAGLKQLSKQRQLEWLDLAKLPVRKSGLEFIATTTSLRQVSFDQCPHVDDAVLEIVKQNRDLEELDLTATAITDEGFAALAGLPKLQVLWIGKTQLTDASVPILVSLPALTTLDCAGTSISSQGRESILAQNSRLKIE